MSEKIHRSPLSLKFGAVIPNPVTPSRIVLARTRRGLTKVDLARLSGISTRTLYDIETGKAQPLPETLEAIAKRTRFPKEFFFRQDVEAPTPDAASFRSLRSMTAAQRLRALAAGALAFEISEWIDARYELPILQIPDLRDYEPEAAAMALRDHWGIGQRPIGNMIHLLESVGVRVFSMVEDRRVDAFSVWHHDVPFVFLNTIKTAEHSRMDAAHELGHLTLHRHGSRWGRDIEKDAQLFASSFLMPRASVMAAPKLSVPTLRHVVQMKKYWLVSAAALAHRLHHLGLLTDWNYRGLCVEISKFGRMREPEGIEAETSQVMAKVFGQATTIGESKATVAQDLGLYPADVEALVFGLRSAATQDQGRGAKRTGKRPHPPRLFRVV
jgi:Zn-dependent peptidase ImmA (M78 family)/DNA-binding XRE family transcriptional regulator